MTDLFEKGKQLLNKTFYKDITEYETFTHFESVFKGAEYNFIVPKVEENKFDWGKADEVIKTQESAGVQISFYVENNLTESFKVKLTEQGYKFLFDDVHVVKQLTESYELGEIDFIEIGENEKAIFIEKVKECFPNFPNNEEFCNFCLELSKKPGNKINKNLAIKIKGEYAAFGSILYSKDLNLGFLHNACTVNEYRHKGFHTLMVKLRANIAFKDGVNIIYANVEENGGSYNSMIKMGFKPELRFNVFSKSV